jgi:hypothetical protein
MPLLLRSGGDSPVEVEHDRVVKIERIEPPTGARPPLAIWSDTEGSYGVDVDLVRHKVMSLAPSGNSPVLTAAKAVGRLIKGSHGT